MCLGNICRSPAAEAAIRRAASQAGLEIDIDSAGTGDWHLGSPPHPKSRAAGAEAGLDVRGTARQVDPNELAGYDLILAMDQSNYADLRSMTTSSSVRDRIRLFRTDGHDVPDPYYGTDDDYRAMIDIVISAAEELVADLAASKPTS